MQSFIRYNLASTPSFLNLNINQNQASLKGSTSQAMHLTGGNLESISSLTVIGDRIGFLEASPPFLVSEARQNFKKDWVSRGSSKLNRSEGQNVERSVLRAGQCMRIESGALTPLRIQRIVIAIVRWPPAESPQTTTFFGLIPS